MDLQRLGAISCDGLKDVIGGFGPDERLWVIVMGLDEGGDGGLGLMDAALDLLVGKESKPAFDLVQPGRAGRSEVQVVARGWRATPALTGGALWVA